MSITIECWGEFACFTRPDCRVERYSYETITPAAACGLLKSIFWKPEFYYKIKIIEVLNPIVFTSFKTNELKTFKKEGADFEVARTQRNNVILRDVHYRITASMHLSDHSTEPTVKKYYEQFNRRMKRNETYRNPCLGMKEYTASISNPTDKPPIPISKDLGSMFFGWNVVTDTTKQRRILRHFFNAKLENGVIIIPDDYDMIQAGRR